MLLSPVLPVGIRYVGSRYWRCCSFAKVCHFLRPKYRRALSGLITDPSGATVSGASVTAKNLDTGISRTVPTDQNGRFRFFALADWPLRGQGDKRRICRRNPVGHPPCGRARCDRRFGSARWSSERASQGHRGCSAGEPDHARYLRPGRRKASQRSAAERTQLRSAAHVESGNCELHVGEDRRHRRLQFDHRQQLCGVRKSPATKHLPVERRGIYRGCRKQHAARAAAARSCWASMRYGNSMCCAILTAPNMASAPVAKSPS